MDTLTHQQVGVMRDLIQEILEITFDIPAFILERAIFIGQFKKILYCFVIAEVLPFAFAHDRTY